MTVLTFIADELFPAHGFFWNGNDFSFVFEVNDFIDCLHVAIDEGKQQFLNIAEFRFFDENQKEISRETLCSAVKLSSSYADEDDDIIFEKFLIGRMLHSRFELRPSLLIKLKEKTKISKILIGNRKDVYGQRSRFLKATALLDGLPIAEKSNSNHNEAQASLSELLFELDLLDQVPRDVNDVAEFVSLIRQRLCDEILAGKFTADHMKLVWFLPLYDPTESPSDFDICICAAILFQLRGDRVYFPPKRLQPISAVLPSDADISRLCDTATQIQRQKTGGTTKFVATKHAIQPPQIASQKDAYLRALDAAFDLLDELGFTLLLCYGSLLGAAREGEFMPHDDDVDLLLINQSASHQEALQNKKDLILALEGHGIAVYPLEENFHAVIGGKTLDLFICWQGTDSTTLLMENFRYRDIPTNILLPPSTVKLYDREYPAPAKPHAFLEERYGPTWTTSDPFYEWPWKLKRILPLKKHVVEDISTN